MVKKQKFIVRFKEGAKHFGDRLCGLIIAEDLDELFDIIDETCDPCEMEALAIPRGTRLYLHSQDDPKWSCLREVYNGRRP